MTTAAATVRGVRRTFGKGRRRVVALDDLTLDIRAGELTALVGPDGAGKTTLLRLMAGLLKPDAGQMSVLGYDVVRQVLAVQARISYMPQNFGLYENLSVRDNFDLYADLYGVAVAEWPARREMLAKATDLTRFLSRPAGKLSGGMKQKLALACALARTPDLLLLDEPTVGVDPLSRRELWQVIDNFIKTEKLTVIVATSYMDEATRSNTAILMHQGKVLRQGTSDDIATLARGLTFSVDPGDVKPRRVQARLLDTPGVVDAMIDAGRVRFIRDETSEPNLGDLQATPVAARFEDAFMLLLHKADSQNRRDAAAGATTNASPRENMKTPGSVIEVHDLVRRFGDFVAVAQVSFSVQRGEIFGLLGPNGAGKTTTFRMLCGLLPASDGTLRVAGQDLRTAPAVARASIGYVAQKFALYGQLSSLENLQFYASAYGLRGREKNTRIDAVIKEFDLQAVANSLGSELPGGYDKRLAMGAALLHRPQVLFLDEATSGADPLTRREFWRRITALAEAGVTVVVTTHFMEEAEYCDHVLIQDAGRRLALGTPDELRAAVPENSADNPATMEQAFIAIVEQARAKAGAAAA